MIQHIEQMLYCVEDWSVHLTANVGQNWLWDVSDTNYESSSYAYATRGIDS